MATNTTETTTIPAKPERNRKMIDIPEEVWTEVKVTAARRSLGVSELVEEALRQHTGLPLASPTV